jgi:hypothetical protein
VDVADKILRGQLINEERVKKEVTQIQQIYKYSFYPLFSKENQLFRFSLTFSLSSHISCPLSFSLPPYHLAVLSVPSSQPLSLLSISLSLSLNSTAQNVARLREMEIDEELKKYRAEVRTALWVIYRPL